MSLNTSDSKLLAHHSRECNPGLHPLSEPVDDLDVRDETDGEGNDKLDDEGEDAEDEAGGALPHLLAEHSVPGACQLKYKKIIF